MHISPFAAPQVMFPQATRVLGHRTHRQEEAESSLTNGIHANVAARNGEDLGFIGKQATADPGRVSPGSVDVHQRIGIRDTVGVSVLDDRVQVVRHGVVRPCLIDVIIHAGERMRIRRHAVRLTRTQGPKNRSQRLQ